LTKIANTFHEFSASVKNGELIVDFKATRTMTLWECKESLTIRLAILTVQNRKTV